MLMTSDRKQFFGKSEEEFFGDVLGCLELLQALTALVYG